MALVSQAHGRQGNANYVSLSARHTGQYLCFQRGGRYQYILHLL